MSKRVCQSFLCRVQFVELNCLRTSNMLSLGELIRLKRIYFSKHFCYCFALLLAYLGKRQKRVQVKEGHSCMIWTKLTRTNAVFSRAACMVLLCVGKWIFGRLRKFPEKTQKIHAPEGLLCQKWDQRAAKGAPGAPLARPGAGPQIGR